MAGGRRARGVARPAGRHELRQRLQRRRPRHRHRPCRAGPAGGVRAGAAQGGQAGRAPRLRRRRRWPVSLSPSPSARCCCWSGRPPSPRAGSTPEGRSPTATTASASCSCSSSSASWPPPARPTSSTERLTGLSVVAGAAVGALACALLVVNNLRDIPTDRAAGKKTLAVRLGDGPTRVLYQGLIAAAFVAAMVAAFVWRLPAALVLLAVPLGLRPVAMVRAGATGRELIRVLGATGQLQLGFGAAVHDRAGPRRLTRRVTRPSHAGGYRSPASPARRPMGDLHELAAAISRRSAAATRLRLRRGRAGDDGREGHGCAGVRDRRAAAVRRHPRPGRHLPRHAGQGGDPRLRRAAEG